MNNDDISQDLWQGSPESVEQTAVALFNEEPDESGLPENETSETNPAPIATEPAAGSQQETLPTKEEPTKAPVIDEEQYKRYLEWQHQQQQQQLPQQQVRQQQPVQSQPQPQTQPLSEEEVARLTNRFTLDEAGYDAIFATEDKQESIRALNQVLQGVVRQAVTMSHYLMQDTAGKIQQTVQPYMQFADSQRELMLRETFFSEHPDLRGSEVIINAVMTGMAQQGVKFSDNKQLFDAVAKATKDQLAALGAKGQMNGQQTQQAQVKPKMARLPAGSGGGSGMAQVHSGGSSTARAVFG